MSNQYQIEFCKGKNGGSAIYVNDESGGHRLFGPKCYGGVQTVYSIPLTKRDISEAITELQRIKSELYG